MEPIKIIYDNKADIISIQFKSEIERKDFMNWINKYNLLRDLFDVETKR